MIQPYRPVYRALLLSAAVLALALIVAGCSSKKPVSKSTSVYSPPASTVKPTVTLSADKTSLNPGESAHLSWTSTDAINLSIAPEVGAVTAQGTTTVTPGSSTTYTITASGPGGNADATVRISVNTDTTTSAAPETRAGPSTLDQLFL